MGDSDENDLCIQGNDLAAARGLQVCCWGSGCEVRGRNHHAVTGLDGVMASLAPIDKVILMSSENKNGVEMVGM